MPRVSARACLGIALAATGLKLLLVPTYRSSDFEVHRNWLAITHSLPVSQWYTDTTSPWTLDYPPFFAWFEYALSHAAKLFDPRMLEVNNLDYASPATVLFQRLSVIASDVLFISAAWALATHTAGSTRSAATGHVLLVLLVLNAGLLLVDHVHFQYNGVVMGLLLWSVRWLLSSSGWLAGAAYAVVVHTKHLYVYCGPIYLSQLLFGWCGRGAAGLGRFLGMGATVIVVSALSLGPFHALGQLPQVLGRLFPFGRGLTHAYWAANAWALYAATDKLLAATAPHLPMHITVTPDTALPVSDGLEADLGTAGHGGGYERMVDAASGLVGVARFRVLPQVPPRVALGLVAVALLPAAVSLAFRPRPSRAPAALAYALLCGFWLGYHVHEKAVLPPLLLLALPATTHPGAAADWLVLAAAGHYGLLPLLYQVHGCIWVMWVHG